MQYTAPVYVALFSYWVLRERITAVDWATVGVILGGMFLFFLDDLAPGNLTGNIFSILSGVFFAFFTMLLRKQKDGSPVEAVMLGNIITALGSLFISKPFPRLLNGAPWFSWAFSSLVSPISFIPLPLEK